MTSNITINNINPDLTILGNIQNLIFDNTDPLVRLNAYSQFTPVVGTNSVINIQTRNVNLAGYRFKQTSATTDTDNFGKFEFQYYINDADTTGTTLWSYFQNAFSFYIASNPVLNLNANAVIFSKPIYGRRVTGLMYFSNNATATTSMAANTWMKVAGTTTLAATGSEISMPANNRLTFTTSEVSNPVPTVFVNANVVFKNAGVGPAATVSFGIYKNGTTLIVPNSNTTMVASATSFNTVSFQVMTTATSTDYFELWVMSSATNTPGLLISDGSISIEAA